MKKIPTLFMRGNDGRLLQPPTKSPGTDWVFQGLGRATRKYDGTAILLDADGWWSRRMVREGKTPPPDFRPVYTTPREPFKTFGWEPVERSSFYKCFREAFDVTHKNDPLAWGTYELIGPKINGNPEGVPVHTLQSHALADPIRLDFDITFDNLRDFFLAELAPKNIEGIVWHYGNGTDDGVMAKLKVSDFVEPTA